MKLFSEKNTFKQREMNYLPLRKKFNIRLAGLEVREKCRSGMIKVRMKRAILS